MKRFAALAFLVASCLTFSDDTADARLQDYARSRGIEFGFAVNPKYLTAGSNYANTTIAETTMVVPTGAMKFDQIHPGNGVWDFSQADAFMDWAKANGKKVRGHCLVWHDQLPTWVTGGGWTGPQLQAILQDHITTLITHFKTKYPGMVLEYDVVNEALNDNGTLRSTIWSKISPNSPAYIGMAFDWAKAADPNVKLYYNDYGTEGLNVKSNAQYSMISNLLAAGKKINGIGMQSHLNNYTSGIATQSDVISNINRLGKLGLEVKITEYDYGMNSADGLTFDNPSDATVQATMYQKWMNACLATEYCVGFLTWGVCDGSSWVHGFWTTKGVPLVCMKDYSKKPAYFSTEAALKADFLNQDFESGAATGWAPTNAANWSVASTSASKQYVATIAGDSISIAGNRLWANYSVMANVTVNSTWSGTAGTAGAGLMARVQDSTRYYMLHLKKDRVTGATSWIITRRDPSAVVSLASGSYPWVNGRAYRLKFSITGSTLSAAVSLDNGVTYTQLGAAKDSTWRAGKIGLRAYSAGASFDKVLVQGL